MSAENDSGPGYGSSKAHVDGWMAGNRRHQSTILDCEYKKTGIRAKGAYAVQPFAARSA